MKLNFETYRNQMRSHPMDPERAQLILDQLKAECAQTEVPDAAAPPVAPRASFTIFRKLAPLAACLAIALGAGGILAPTSPFFSTSITTADADMPLRPTQRIEFTDWSFVDYDWENTDPNAPWNLSQSHACEFAVTVFAPSHQTDMASIAIEGANDLTLLPPSEEENAELGKANAETGLVVTKKEAGFSFRIRRNIEMTATKYNQIYGDFSEGTAARILEPTNLLRSLENARISINSDGHTQRYRIDFAPSAEQRPLELQMANARFSQRPIIFRLLPESE